MGLFGNGKKKEATYVEDDTAVAQDSNATQIESLKIEIEALEKQLAAASMVEDNLRDKIKELGEENDKLQVFRQQAEAQPEDIPKYAQGEMLREIERLRQENETLSKAIDNNSGSSVSADNSALIAENEKLKRENSEQKTLLDKAKASLIAWKERCDTAEASYKKIQEKGSLLLQKYQAALQEIATLKAGNGGNGEDMGALHSKIAELQGKVEILETKNEELQKYENMVRIMQRTIGTE